jgi:acetolactate synthase-1/2/3 large subunit
MLGMHGNYAPNLFTNECDVLIAIGMRFDDRVTGRLDKYAKQAQIIHLDIDPAEIDKNVMVSIPVWGNCKDTLPLLTERIEAKTHQEWISKFHDAIKVETEKLITPELFPSEGEITMGEVIQLINELTSGEAVMVTDVGQHQMWSAQLINCQPKKWISSSGLGTMGFGLPAAIGAKVANPNQDVICITGDSSIQMSIQELGTISQYQLAIKTVIINNGWQGMVRQWQESFYGNRFSNSYMKNGMPNFAELARAYSIQGIELDNFNSLVQLLENKSYQNQAIMIDVNVIANENCYPMVAPGRSNSQMLGLQKANS